MAYWDSTDIGEGKESVLAKQIKGKAVVIVYTNV